MFEIPDQYTDDSDFLDFLNREFDRTAANATMEELVEFAFGSLDEAIEAFQRHKEN